MSIRADQPYVELLNELVQVPRMIDAREFEEARDRALALKAACAARGLRSPQVYWTAAIAHDSAGELEMAFQDMRTALSLDPVFPGGWKSYRIIVERMRAALVDPRRPPDDPLAPRLYQALVASDEATSDCHLAMARVHRHSGRPGEALKLAQAVTMLHPALAAGWREVAVAARAAGFPDVADAAERSAIECGDAPPPLLAPLGAVAQA